MYVSYLLRSISSSYQLEFLDLEEILNRFEIDIIITFYCFPQHKKLAIGTIYSVHFGVLLSDTDDTRIKAPLRQSRSPCKSSDRAGYSERFRRQESISNQLKSYGSHLQSHLTSLPCPS